MQNFAKLETSDRLQRILSLLTDGRAHTTLDIIQGAKVAAVSASVSELRFNGYNIDCRRNGKVFEYRISPPSRMKALGALLAIELRKAA